MKERQLYEEDRMISPLWGWVILILFSASILGWGMFMMMMIMDAPREWDMGDLPDTPASSIYSSIEPRIWITPPRQLAPVPGSVPIEQVKHGPFSPPEPRERVPRTIEVPQDED